MSSYSKKICICMMCMITSIHLVGRVVKGRREAYGAERATTVEKLLQKLYPGTTIQWDPHLAIRDASGKSELVELGDLSSMRQSDGSMISVTHLQVGTAKRDYIENAQQFRPVARQTFTTEIIVFRSDSLGNIVDLKKIPIDPSQPVTKVSWFSVQSWGSDGWPIVRVGYESYSVRDNEFIAISWDGIVDLSKGSFLARIPSGILIKKHDGTQSEDILATHRVGPSEIEISGAISKKTLQYSCSDPCVVDSKALLAQWIH